jgi:hypothetical protein
VALTLLSLISIDRPKTPEEVIAHKGSPAARRRYREAFAYIASFGWKAKMALVSAFVKVEKWAIDYLHIKPPRLIQFRCYEYCAALSCYLLAIEEQLWKITIKGLEVFAKSMNSFKTASVLDQMRLDFVDPVFIEADHSKFDSCVSKPWIWLEHKFYTTAMPSDELEELMGMQYENRAYTKHGIKYWCSGRKMSGEYNTSLGDTLINYCVLSDVFSGVRHRLLLNGDDSVICLERSDLPKLDLSAAKWLEYGFKTTWKVVDTMEDLSFCQAKPVQLRPGVWRMVREPKRAISRSLISTKRYEGKAWYSLVAAMGHSELACGDGVPMMQAWGQCLIRASNGAVALEGELSRRANKEVTLTPEIKPITALARQSFEAAFGISAQEQEAFESWCDYQHLDVLPAVHPDDRVI